jgi:hypothetical protein
MDATSADHWTRRHSRRRLTLRIGVRSHLKTVGFFRGNGYRKTRSSIFLPPALGRRWSLGPGPSAPGVASLRWSGLVSRPPRHAGSARVNSRKSNTYSANVVQRIIRPKAPSRRPAKGSGLPGSSGLQSKSQRPTSGRPVHPVRAPDAPIPAPLGVEPSPAMEVSRVVIDENADAAGQLSCSNCLKGVPKTHVYRVIRSGEVRLNKGRASADTRVALKATLRSACRRVRLAQSARTRRCRPRPPSSRAAGRRSPAGHQQTGRCGRARRQWRQLRGDRAVAPSARPHRPFPGTGAPAGQGNLGHPAAGQEALVR